MEELHGAGELQAECVGGDLLGNPEGAKTAVVQFLGRPPSPNVFGKEPDPLAYLEVRRRCPEAISGPDLLVLSHGDLFPEIGVEFGKGFGKVVCIGGRDGAVQGDREGWMVAVVSEEGSDLDSGVGGVVVGELRKWQEFGPVTLTVIAV